VSSRDWKLRIKDIYDSLQAIQQRTANLTQQQFRNDETIIKAVLYDFLVIGEAARVIPNDIQSRYPEIPWRLMIDMRNVVSHEYFQVQINMVWRSLSEDLPALKQQIIALMEQESIS
jgi:uncharacterized protein with HEPN domain